MRPCRIVQGDIRAIFESSPALIKIKTIEKPWECIFVFRQLQHEPVHILKNSSIAQEYVAGRSEPPTEVGGPLELPQGEASQHTMGQMSPELARVPEGKMPCRLAFFSRRVIATQGGVVVFFGFNESVQPVSDGCDAVGFYRRHS